MLQVLADRARSRPRLAGLSRATEPHRCGSPATAGRKGSGPSRTARLGLKGLGVMKWRLAHLYSALI